MKKFLQITAVLVVSLCYVSNVNAATEQDLIDYASKYATASEMVQLKQFLSENEVTSTEADQIIAKADEIVAIMDNAGVSEISQLTKEQKQQAFSIAKEAAAIVDVQLTYDSKNEQIIPYKDGKALTAVPINKNQTLAKTGNDSTVYVAISGLAAVLAGSAILRKLKGNA
jgi:LPXTG-motif cell wall-anchored protein